MREGLSQALQMSPTALRKAIRRKRLVRRTADPRVFVVKNTLGDSQHVLVVKDAGEIECESFDCRAVEFGWNCWAARRAADPRRIARSVRRDRERVTA